MFGMLRFAMTLSICVLIVGFYLGWFSFSRSLPDPKSNKVNINVSVDQNKVRSDLQKAEQNLSRRIQEVQSQPQGSTGTPLSGRQPAVPGMNLGPISAQPPAQPAEPTDSQAVGPTWPFTIPSTSRAAAPPSQPAPSQPAGQSQAPDYQFTVPLAVPPPGEGR